MAKEKKNQSVAEKMEMTLEESRAYRASLYVPTARVLSENERREAFRIFWASHKAQYGKAKSLEKTVWLHLKAIKMDTPETFENGLVHFGLKKIK